MFVFFLKKKTITVDNTVYVCIRKPSIRMHHSYFDFTRIEKGGTANEEMFTFHQDWFNSNVLLPQLIALLQSKSIPDSWYNIHKWIVFSKFCGVSRLYLHKIYLTQIANCLPFLFKTCKIQVKNSDHILKKTFHK